MKNLAFYLFSLLIIMSSAACVEDDDMPSCTDCPEEVSSFSQLAVGNYWVYDVQKLDENGVDIEQFGTDSLYISGDTLINGNTYYVHQTTNDFFAESSMPVLLRDSSDFIVNHLGEVVFSTTVFDEVLGTYLSDNGLYTVEYKMVDKDLEITVPAGTFLTYNARGIVHFDETQVNVALNDRPLNHQYAKDIGLVQSNTFFASHTSSYERRLVRYHLE